MKIPPPIHRTWRRMKFYGYGQGWLNRLSRKQFESRPPILSVVQEGVVEALRREGYARIDVRELIPDLWPEAAQAGNEFIGSDRVRQGIESYRPEDGTQSGKQYIVKLRDSRPALPVSDLWVRIGLAPAFLDTVNAYLGLWSKLNYADLWYTIPSLVERQPVASQRWHRDPEDRRLVKIFLYLSDVDAGAGPFEYVPGSQQRGPYEHLWPNPDPGTASYPPDGAIEAKFSSTDRFTGTGPAGTLVFCDTYGFHRGGFATERARVLATWAYVSPASIFARRFVVSEPIDSIGLSEPARFALL